MYDDRDIFGDNEGSGGPRGCAFLVCVLLGVVFWVLLEATNIKFFLYPFILFMGLWVTWIVCIFIFAVTGRRALSWVISAVIVYGGFACILIFG